MGLVDTLRDSSARTKGIIGAGVVVVLVVAGGVGYALTSGDDAKPVAAASPSPSIAPSASAVPTPAATTAPAGPVNPLTGLAPFPNGPVIAVKIDDTPPGRPQVGIDQADIVYIEEAEGGLTRDVAVFASKKPIVGYVRSTRASDPELLSQYGPIVLAASGGGGDALPTLDKSILKSYIQDRGAPLYYRTNSNPAPYNVQLNLAKLSTAISAGGVHDIGWTWNADASPYATTPAASTITGKVGGTPVGFSWDPSTSKYVRVINGAKQKAASGNLISTPNVIVQFCTVTTNNKDIDRAGNPGKYTHSVGTGKVSVFRDGHRIDGTWNRTSIDNGTTLTDANGQPISLSPGGAYVVLATVGAPLTSK